LIAHLTGPDPGEPSEITTTSTSIMDIQASTEARDGMPECVVGRVETGAFIAVPPVAG
jgi:hypothetical protein